MTPAGNRALAVLWLLAFLAGCQSVRYEADSPSATTVRQGASVSFAGGDRLVAGVIVAVMLVEGVRYYVRGEDGTLAELERLPPLDPYRRVNEQDCTRPVDPALGNLRCR